MNKLFDIFYICESSGRTHQIPKFYLILICICGMNTNEYKAVIRTGISPHLFCAGDGAGRLGLGISYLLRTFSNIWEHKLLVFPTLFWFVATEF